MALWPDRPSTWNIMRVLPQRRNGERHLTYLCLHLFALHIPAVFAGNSTFHVLPLPFSIIVKGARMASNSVQSEPWIQNDTAQGVLNYTHSATPVILLFFFLIFFTLRSILGASYAKSTGPTAHQEATGPGGKPLPGRTERKGDVEAPLDFSRSRQLLFEWLSLAAACTFLLNATDVLIHALVERNEGWWCGKPMVVGLLTPCPVPGIERQRSDH